MDTKTKEKCKNTSYFTPEMFSYWKASQQDANNKSAQPNVYGRGLSLIIAKAFKRITGSESDTKFMEEVFCYPQEACKYASMRMRQTYDVISNQENKDSRPLNNENLFEMFQEQYLYRTVEELIELAEMSRIGSKMTGQEKILLWAGEKGIGKTTLLNYIFLKNRPVINDQHVIWIRFSVFLRYQVFNINEIENRFYQKVIEIVREHYRSYINLEAYEDKKAIWADLLKKFEEKNDPEKAKMIEEWEKDIKKYAMTLIQYMYRRKWAFIFILDNIDQYDNTEITKDIINFAVLLSRKPVRSVVVVVARTDTINDHVAFFRDQNHNFERREFISSPDFNEVINKRLLYIMNHLSDATKIKKYTDFNTSVEVEEGMLATILIKYFLNYSESNPNNYFIADLANENIRDVFEMIKSMLKTHVVDIVSTPVYSIIKNRVKITPETVDKEVIHPLRKHSIVWSLMLRDNNLYYKNEADKTWLMNIYDVRTERDSYYLKRLILDFLVFMKSKEIDYVYDHQLKSVFTTEMEFGEDEFEYNLKLLTSRKNTNPLISYINDGNAYKYSITPKGELYANEISEMYVYLELIIENTLLPLKKVNKKNGIEINLYPYEPLEEPPELRKKATINYFKKKREHVEAFLFFMQCREYKEKELHNGFNSISTGFNISYFSRMRINVDDQEIKISEALGIQPMHTRW